MRTQTQPPQVLPLQTQLSHAQLPQAQAQLLQAWRTQVQLMHDGRWSAADAYVITAMAVRLQAQLSQAQRTQAQVPR